jgi:metal-responsive CopG/Arc/MetJ family transcriptional regulator
MVTRKTGGGKKMVAITLKLPEEWLEAIDAWVAAQPSLINRSDALREVIREKFVEPYKPPAKKTPRK